MRVILVRHGQTDWNEERIFRGSIDVELNREGLEQAQIIGRRLAGTLLDAIYSSPLSRAAKTAELIASFHDLVVDFREEFTDINFGEWQGLKREAARQRYPEIYRVWEESPDKVRIPGAETLEEVRERITGGLKRILWEHTEGTVVIVSHGLTNKVLLCAVLGMGNAHFWKVKQDNGAVNIFKYTESGTKLFLMNDTSHLQSINEIVESMKDIENPLG
jgi:broad specificity phosphatase PhoE